MNYSHEINGNMCKFRVSGKFTRDDLETSQNILSFIKEKRLNNVYFDLSELTFIDSSALGQLLFIRDAITHLKGKVVLAHPTGQIKEMFRVGNFYEFFHIEE